jgi:cation transport ATPase
MLALGLGIKVWHIIALVVWFFFCCYVIYDQIEEKGEFFWPSTGFGCAVFFITPALIYAVWLLGRWLKHLMNFEIL